LNALPRFFLFDDAKIIQISRSSKLKIVLRADLALRNLCKVLKISAKGEKIKI
jgi:hypothetical protein